MPQIIVSADYIPARKLHHQLSSSLPKHNPELVRISDTERGISAEEAVVIAAIITTLGVIMAEVIKGLVAVYVERRKTGKSGPDTVIVVQYGQSAPIIRVNPEEYIDKSIEEIQLALPDLPESEHQEDKIWAQYLDDE